ncbi:EIF4EBP3 [Cordylochernes scorpioides]|uniref:EIF4EBP3 n=1 Tax=Cordylochernes scorpioides TaxID=51811 RepID=A0ABY6LSQ6_9ARAC|nr:EIF4EBP3 [Cordylochernes scorpioides]
MTENKDKVECCPIPLKKITYNDHSQLPDDYSSTPGGTIFSTTPGGQIGGELSLLQEKLGNSQVEHIRKIQMAFGDNAMGGTQIKEWYNRFKDDCTSMDSEPHSGHPLTS